MVQFFWPTLYLSVVFCYLLVVTFIEFTCDQGSTTALQRTLSLTQSINQSADRRNGIKPMSICYAFKCVKSNKQSETIHWKLLQHDVLNLVFKKTFFLQLTVVYHMGGSRHFVWGGAWGAGPFPEFFLTFWLEMVVVVFIQSCGGHKTK